jgi:hypothetical protein
MKRRIIAMAGLMAALSACSGSRESPADPTQPASGASSWVQPPRIEAVTRQGGGLVVRGRAGPGARVVLRGDGEAGSAVSADAAGRFELRMTPPVGEVLLTPEVQTGEDAAVSPDRLLLIANGPAALVSPGGPTRRLDGAGPLEAVDFDGAALQLVGRSAEGRPVVTVDGAAMDVVPLGGGRWRAALTGGGPRLILVGGRAYAYPGEGGAESDVARAGQGWRITLPTPPRGRQSVWLPD